MRFSTEEAAMALTINVYGGAVERAPLSSAPSEALPTDAGACAALSPLGPPAYPEVAGQMIDAGPPVPALVEEIEAALRTAGAAEAQAPSASDAIDAGA